MVRAVALGLILGMLGSTPAARAAGVLAAVRSRGTLRWGGDIQGGEPYAFQDPHDSSRLEGFEVDIAAALAQRLGVRAQFVQNDWLTLIPSLERGDFDIILNGLEVTTARRRRVAFTRPYYAFTEALVVRAAQAGIHDLGDLRGKRVGTLDGSLAFELLRHAAVEPVLYEGVEEPYADLEQHRVDAVLLDDIIAARYGLSRPSLRLAGTVGSGVYAIGVRPDAADLLRALDAGLNGMMAGGELRAILERWHLWDERQAPLFANPPAAAPPPAPPPALTSAQLLLFGRAAAFTVAISTLAMGVAVLGGLLLSLVRRYGARPLRALATGYVEVWRGTPLLLQLYVLYYGFAPFLRLGAFTAAVVGLGMNYAAYEAELYRAGIEAVPVGQTEAALSLGMSHALALRRIVLPQALRVALPGVANDFIALLKDSSLVSVITVIELTKQMTITAVDARGWLLPGVLCGALYLGLSYPLARLARGLERRLTPTAR